MQTFLKDFLALKILQNEIFVVRRQKPKHDEYIEPEAKLFMLVQQALRKQVCFWI